jgi:prepilin-type N-terminal cleavage/methylation domain-containing protein
MRAAPSIPRGFTLYELMIVVGIAGLLIGLGVPGLTQFVRSNQMTSAANDLLAAIHMARAESVKRRLPTEMCFTQDPTAATPVCDGTGMQGWVVWVDDANPDATAATDNNGVVNAGEPILLRHGALPAVINLVSKPAGNAGYVAFQDTGFVKVAANDLAGLVLCDPKKGNSAQYGASASTARGLVISAVGRPSVTRDVSTITSDANLLNGGSCP